MSNADLTKALLSMPTAPPVRRPVSEREFTSEISVRQDGVELTVNAPAGLVNEGTGLLYLEEEKLNPAEWEATHFKKIKYGEGMESVKFSYRRVLAPGAGVDIDELVRSIKRRKPKAKRAEGDHTYVVAGGDFQFGKGDGDGVDGSVRRVIDYLDQSRDLLEAHRQRFDIGHVHIPFLGDHIEGFVSQGGANVWRTHLTLNEQIRLVRRVMFHALDLFVDSAERVSMVAVPGNHGETQRFSGKGVTRYDDSHDTESLIAVADATKLNAKTFGHVEFYTPEEDEMVVVLDCSGTTIGHAHGHQFRPGKHFDWWRGQSFGGSPLQHADVLLCGHMHHELLEGEGPKTFIQVPATESESTWWRHAKGTPGNPGLLTFVTKDGRVKALEVIR